MKPNPNVAEAVNPTEKITADRWAETAAAICARSFRPAMLAIIVSRGEDEFIRIARPIYAGHGFSQHHFKRIFAVIKRTSQLNPPDAHDPNVEFIQG